MNSIKTKRAIAITVVAGLLFATATQTAAASTTGEQSGIAIIYDTSNQYRAQTGAKPLKVYNQINTVSQKWADYLAKNRTLKHNPSFGSQMPQKGVTYMGENVAFACGYGDAKATAKEIMKGWRNSSGHYKNIITKRYTHIGIGYSYNSSTKCGYAVQNFGDYSNLGSSQPNHAQPIINNGPFIDVNFDAKRGQKGYHQFAANIEWAYENNVTNGYSVSDGKAFKPETDLDRGAMAAFLYRQYGNGEAVNLNVLNKIKDVDRNHQFAKPIAWMIQNGISTGYSDGTYKPNRNIDRDAMAAFLYRIAVKENDPSVKTVNVSQSLKGVKDMNSKSAFAKPVAWMIQNGISTGYSDGTYRPRSDVSRGATVTFMKRIEDKISNM